MLLRDKVELEELYPLMAEVIENGGTFRFYPRGQSMEPMLVQGRDSVELGKAEDIKIGDVVFYRRTNGQFVLHRIVAMHNGLYTMSGDNHGTWMEHGIAPRQILFKLVGFYIGEEYHSVEEEEYKKYSAKRLSSIPFYYRNSAIHSFLRKVKHFIFK